MRFNTFLHSVYALNGKYSLKKWTPQRVKVSYTRSRICKKIGGWIWYFGTIERNSLKPVFYHLHYRILKWIVNKYKRFRGSRIRTVKWFRDMTRSYPNLFYHWPFGYVLT